jgi:hypothetical protein
VLPTGEGLVTPHVYLADPMLRSYNGQKQSYQYIPALQPELRAGFKFRVFFEDITID